jgi:NET1-associated nuclear protein 1 (U3 small nucleolar RNA-associated protein 17)
MRSDLSIWSLKVVWSHAASSTFGRSALLVPHPKNDTFAVVATLVHPLDKNGFRPPSESRITIFSASSPRPLRTQSLPFTLKFTTWYEQAPINFPPIASTSTPTNLKIDHYSLVGLTADHNAVVIGDEAAMKPLEGNHARGITSVDDAIFGRSTLFQDIFGQSALAGVHSSGTESFISAPVTVSKNRSLELRVFDGPAHLLPPIRTLFDSLIQSFIQLPRSTLQSVSEREKKSEADVMVNTEMNDYANAGAGAGASLVEQTSSVKPRKARHIDPEEMEIITELFRTMLTSPGSRSPDFLPTRIM